MIISASYKTDIPTFYGEWFLNRLRAGYCKIVNPYNRKTIHVDLTRQSVDGFVFWTKNAGPFVECLTEVRERGFPFIVQHTINNYPRELETSVVNAQRSIENLRRIADSHGARVPVWRYDTIVATSFTPLSWHADNFERLAKQLEGATDEVVVSFAQIYKKTLHNMNRAAKEVGFSWRDPSNDEKRDLLATLVDIASSHRMRLTVCSQRDLIVDGAADARCIDAERLSEVAGEQLKARLKGNRAECGCFESRDIGDYDTCPHGCVYCYAVRKRETAVRRHREHDPEGEFLYTQPPREAAVPRQASLPLIDD